MKDYPISYDKEPIRKALPVIKPSWLSVYGFALFITSSFGVLMLIGYLSGSAQIDESNKDQQIQLNIKNYSCGELYVFMNHELVKGYVSDNGSYYYSSLLDLETKQFNEKGCK